jgi:hypothetical protein
MMKVCPALAGLGISAPDAHPFDPLMKVLR